MGKKVTTTMLASQTTQHYESILVEVKEIKRRLGSIDRQLGELNGRVNKNVLEIERNKVNKIFWLIFTLISNIAVASLTYTILR